MADARTAARHTTPIVLVIDDEDYVADMIATALQLEEYTVYTAYNGQQGLDRARSLNVDLVIVDIMMPYLSGDELVDLLRAEAHLRAVPIIMISAGARPRRQLDGVTFLPKPFDIDRVLNLVDERLRHGDGQAQAIS